MADETEDVFSRVADLYDEFYLPTLIQEWVPRVADAARLIPGDKVLDVACGTGVLAIEAAIRVRPRGAVTGLDPNEGMLANARRKAPHIEWHLGNGESLPFPDGSFDAVVSQFGLMFFSDRVAGLQEMWRVLRHQGRLSVAVWGRVEDSPGYADAAILLRRLFGESAEAALRAPFDLGDAKELEALCQRAGIHNATIRTVQGMVRYPSLESWVRYDLKEFTLGEMIDDSQYESLVRESREQLARYVDADGRVVFPISSNLLVATKD